MIRAIDHVQIAIPVGGEEQARPFYRDLLGLTEVAKPAELAKRGGAWFEGAVKVHLGVEEDFRANVKAHVAFEVDDVAGLATRAVAAGFDAISDGALEGFERIYIHDPFGNRLEFLKQAKITAPGDLAGGGFAAFANGHARLMHDLMAFMTNYVSRAAALTDDPQGREVVVKTSVSASVYPLFQAFDERSQHVLIKALEEKAAQLKSSLGGSETVN